MTNQATVVDNLNGTATLVVTLGNKTKTYILDHENENGWSPVCAVNRAIFSLTGMSVHIWDGPESATSGCTAMQRDPLETIVTWLGAESDPILVQLSEPEYFRLLRDWQLPQF